MKRIDFTNTQVASSQTARDINRGVVLNLIRRRQPISRADLARVSGLQRSTVSLITEQLIREKWVVHGPIGRLPRGRRPTFLRLNDRRAILVADLRPAQTTVGIADVNGNFLSQETMPTTRDPGFTAGALAAKIRHLMQVYSDRVFERVGISIPVRLRRPGMLRSLSIQPGGPALLPRIDQVLRWTDVPRSARFGRVRRSSGSQGPGPHGARTRKRDAYARRRIGSRRNCRCR